MKQFRRLSIFLLALLLVGSFAVPAFAGSASITYAGHDIFGFGPDGELHDMDLFDNFKGVMPGDVLTQTIIIRNEASCCDFVKVYLRAEAPAGATAAEKDFLSQLSMTVKNGDELIYAASPEQLGGLKENVLLGTLDQGEETTLTVQLTVPATLDYHYHNRTGEVDWIVLVEEYEFPDSDTTPDPGADRYPDAPKTGDHSHMLLYVLLMVVTGLGMALMVPGFRRKKKTN